MSKPVCRICGGHVLYGDLHCSLGCALVHSATTSGAIAELKRQGFVKDPETPNIYLKDGVATTLEHIHHVGLEKAIQHHAQAAQIRRP